MLVGSNKLLVSCCAKLYFDMGATVAAKVTHVLAAEVLHSTSA